jgi:hypothetical protein
MMANISEALKHPILLAIIPAIVGVGVTEYNALKGADNKPAKEKTVSEDEKIFWASIQPPNDSEAKYCAYLTKYPKGEFVELALPECFAALEAKRLAEEQAAEIAEQKAEAEQAAQQQAAEMAQQKAEQ